MTKILPYGQTIGQVYKGENIWANQHKVFVKNILDNFDI